MAMQQRVRLGRRQESVEDGLAGERDGEGEQATGEQLSVDGDVRVDVEERGGGEGAEAVQAGEDFVV